MVTDIQIDSAAVMFVLHEKKSIDIINRERKK
jgi:hypothetical protein